MITLVYVAENSSPLFENEMRELSGIEEVQCICITDNYLAKALNNVLDRADHDIVVFLNEGVRVCSLNWGRRVVDTFSTSSHGIIGTLGTLIVPMSAMLWEKEEPLCGSIWYEEYLPKYRNNFGEIFEDKVLDVMTLEGSFFALHKHRIATTFDENFTGNSFYEHDFFVENISNGVKVGVIFGIDILKKAYDDQDKGFLTNRKKFVEKHKKDLPYRTIPKIFVDKEDVTTSSSPSVGIIITNKGHPLELYTCLESIYEKTSYTNYTITIVDYGSSKEEIMEIASFISKHNNTKLKTISQPHIPQVCNLAVNDIEADLLIFMSKQLVLINDIISLMVETYIKNPSKCGTIGIRTHQKNHMLRQMGLQLYSMETEEGYELGLDLKGYGKAYAYTNSTLEGVMGNSKECLLIEREVFLSHGGFNISYQHNLEDFEFSLKMILEGRKNYLVGNAVAYYLGIDRPKFLPKDYILLMDFINKNIDPIIPYVHLMIA